MRRQIGGQSADFDFPCGLQTVVYTKHLSACNAQIVDYTLKWIDIREFLSTSDFQSFTRKGVRLNAAQFAAFMKTAAEIQTLL